MSHMAKQRWQSIASPSTVFALSPVIEDSWVLGTNEGVWKFVNGVCSITADALRPAAITAVAATVALPMYTLLLAGAADGIARSVDGGQTWATAQMIKPVQVTQLLISNTFQGDSFAVAATMQDGVLCSADHGLSWQGYNIGMLDHETTAIALSPHLNTDETVFVATVTGLYRSTNFGRAWRDVPLPPGAAPLSSLTFCGDVLVAGSENQGLLYTQDMGVSWARRNSYKSGPVSVVATSPDGLTLALATPAVVAVSKDQGKTWLRAEGHVPANIISLGVGNDALVLVGTQEEGLWIYGAG